MTTPTAPRVIDAESARAMGIWTEHSQMPNGEFRFRLKHSDGTAYIRTEAILSHGWQKSHFHKLVRETYIVQQGRIALAELIDNTLRLRIYETGGLFTTEPYVSHNIYMFAGSIIHTVKHGPGGHQDDWFANPDLDRRTVDLGYASGEHRGRTVFGAIIEGQAATARRVSFQFHGSKSATLFAG